MARMLPAPEIVSLHEAYAALWNSFAEQFRDHLASVERLARTTDVELHDLLRLAYWVPSHFLRKTGPDEKTLVGSAPGFFFEHLGASAVAARLERRVPGVETFRNRLPSGLDPSRQLPPRPDLIAYHPGTQRAAVFEFKASPSAADLAGVVGQRARHTAYLCGGAPVAFFLVGGRVSKRLLGGPVATSGWTAVLRCAIDGDDSELDPLPRVDKLISRAARHLSADARTPR